MLGYKNKNKLSTVIELRRGYMFILWYLFYFIILLYHNEWSMDWSWWRVITKARFADLPSRLIETPDIISCKRIHRGSLPTFADESICKWEVKASFPIGLLTTFVTAVHRLRIICLLNFSSNYKLEILSKHWIYYIMTGAYD